MTARRALLAVLGALAVLAPVADAKRVRVFAVGPKFDLSWVQTRETYRDKLFALVDKRKRAQVSVSIQKGADDVASNLLGPTDPSRPVQTARDLVTLPEDLGLLAALTGRRGEVARRQGTLADAIAATFVAHGDLMAHYQAKFPELADRPFPPTRLLNVALTDTFARVGVETFAELADTYDTYLEAGVNMVTEWRVVCVSRATYEPPPGNPPCAAEDPALVARLRTPEDVGRTYAYEAVNARASNMALLFDPDGRLIAKEVKSYPTPTEAPGLLDLRPGHVTGLRAVDTPVGRLGFVTSRDAFMPDVVERLDQQHVEILVQPEFFVGDFVQTKGMWAPDTLKASGFSALQRLPSIEALVLPETTGNVFELTADAQQHIAVKPRSRTGPRGGLVGQEPELGFTQVQSWLTRDPARPGEPMAERRQRLGAAGEAASATGGGPECPSSLEPGPCRGGQVEGVLAQDVQVQVERGRRVQRRRKRGRTPFAVNRPIAPSARPQRNVALAARGDRVWAVFEQHEDGRDRILLARSFNGGRTWTRARRPIASAPSDATDEWWPSISAGPDGTVWLAWQQSGAGGRHEVLYSRSTTDGRTWSPPRDVAAGESRQWKPSIAGTGAGTAYVAWIDERERFADETDLPQAALYGARILADGPAEPARLDGGAVAELARTQDHAWAPSVVADGDRVLLAWMDLRTYDWRIYAIQSTDGGQTFGPEQPVQDTPPVKTHPLAPPENEALNADPAAVLGARGPFVAFTDFRKRADAATRAHSLYDTMLAAPGAANLQVDPHGSAQVSTYSPAAAALPGGDVVVAWQDMAAGPADIQVARASGGTARRAAVRVDDSGTAGWNQWRPAIVPTARGRVLVAWEDERDGPANVFASYVSAGRLP